MAAREAMAHPDVKELLRYGEKVGCVEISRLDEVARGAFLSQDEIEAVEDEIETRSISLEDDCGRTDAPPASYENGDVADATTEALSLFLREVRRLPLLTPAQEVDRARLATEREQGALRQAA